MGKGEDRISNLPDEIIQYILCLMPLKHAITTSTLSKRWRNLWQYNLTSSTALQFCEDFSCNQSPKQFVATLNRYLQLHGNRNIDKFHILFSPFDLFFPDIENWVRTAIAKNVRDLELDLSQGVISSYSGLYLDEREPFVLPNSLFHCNSLTRLSLSRCDLPDPLDLTNFHSLISLTLDQSDVNDEMLTNLLENCTSLESLSLKRCQFLAAVKFSGRELKLKKLVMVDCRGMYEIEISAPKLESFVYHGRLCFTDSFVNVSGLVDAYICLFGLEDYDWEDQYFKLLMDLAHVKVLTICSIGVVHTVIEQEYDEDDFPIELRNLQELQILMDCITEEHLTCIFSFFDLCPTPFLERLFIQLPYNLEESTDISDMVSSDNEIPGVLFNHLKWIKISNFRGSNIELQFVKTLLEKSPVLESIILVTPQCEKILKQSLFLRIIQGQLLLLPKASPKVSIILCEPSDGDCTVNPTHTWFYHEEKYRLGTSVHLEQSLFGGEDALLNEEFL